MPLPLTVLDKLNYDELVADARRTLPALAPEWTDFNAHDPGITLIELFAWLAESDSYRLDQSSELSYRAFLRMSGVELRAPEIAETTLVFEPLLGAVNLPAGIQAQTPDAKIVFQTAAPLHVSIAKLIAVHGGKSASLENWTEANRSATSYRPFGVAPQFGDALYLGFDVPLASEGTEITLWVFTGRDTEEYATRRQLRSEHESAKSEAQRWCPSYTADNFPEWHAHYGVRTQWEFHVGAGQWQALNEVVDETRALTLSGPVRFKAPTPVNHKLGGAAALEGKYCIRCRFVQGAYDCPPQIAKIVINGTLAIHSVDVPQESFNSTGRASQKLSLRSKPVAPGSVTLRVEETNKPASVWEERESFDGVGPHDATHLLFCNAGVIEFGNGRVGRVPPADAILTVSYRKGGGAVGNVLGLTQMIDGNLGVKVSQPFTAYGGADAESLTAAKARAVNELAARTRAVTVDDFETLTLAIPGLPIARAHAIDDYHPEMNCIRVSGSVTVVVIPTCFASRPEPTPALLSAAKKYLSRRRLLTGELHVVRPKLTAVSIRAQLHLIADANARDVTRRARETLLEFFHPLSGGQDATGYPIGRAVFRSELMALLNQVAGVEYVSALYWRADDGEWSQCGSIDICPHGLPVSGAHEIKVDARNNCHE